MPLRMSLVDGTIRLRRFLIVADLSTVAITVAVSATVEEDFAVLLVVAVVVASITEELSFSAISTAVGRPVGGVVWVAVCETRGGSGVLLVSTIRAHPVLPKVDPLPVVSEGCQGRVEQSVSVEKRGGESTQATSVLTAVDAIPVFYSKIITTGRSFEKCHPR